MTPAEETRQTKPGFSIRTGSLRVLTRTLLALQRSGRLGEWITIAVLLTAVMHAAARHFSGAIDSQTIANSASRKDGGSDETGSNSGQTAWWKSDALLTPLPGVTDESASVPSESSGGRSIIPINRDFRFSSVTPQLRNEPAPPSSGPSLAEEVYVRLGLGAPAANPASLADGSELRFQLSGTLAQGAAYNFPDAGISLTAVPEPAIGGILAAALVALSFRRHRGPVRCAPVRGV